MRCRCIFRSNLSLAMKFYERVVKSHFFELSVKDAIQFASDCGLSLRWPEPNSTIGNSLFEAVPDRLSNQPFNEVLEKIPHF